MINEIHFQKVLPEFEGSGKTVQQYMVPAYYWLGWGIKGNREIYSYNYSKKLYWHDQILTDALKHSRTQIWKNECAIDENILIV